MSHAAQPLRHEAARVACSRCAVDFRPERTDGVCPICREPAPGHTAPAEPAPGEHRLQIVLLMGALNMLVLGLFAAWLFG